MLRSEFRRRLERVRHNVAISLGRDFIYGDLFHDSDFIALKDALGLVPVFSSGWPISVQIDYQSAITDVLREESRIEHQNAVLQSLHGRNYNKKFGLDVFEAKSDNLSIPFE